MYSPLCDARLDAQKEVGISMCIILFIHLFSYFVHLDSTLASWLLVSRLIWMQFSLEVKVGGEREREGGIGGREEGGSHPVGG